MTGVARRGKNGTAAEMSGAAGMDVLSLIDDLSDAVIGADAEARIVDVNAAACTLLGYSRDELIGRVAIDLVAAPGSWGEEQLERFRREGYWRDELSLRRRDGSVVHVRAAATVAPVSSGPRYVAVIHDITQQQRADEALALLAEASTVLTASLDYATTVRQLLRLIVPRLADWGAIDVAEPDGTIARLSVAAADPVLEARLTELMQRYPIDTNGQHPVAVALRTGESVLTARVTEASMRRIAQDDEHLALLREAGTRSRITVPMVARGQSIGVLALGYTRRHRRYGQDDLAFAEEFARRAAAAIDNARLYHEAESARRRYENLVEGLDAIVWEADARTWEFSYVNQHAERVLGYPVELWLGDPDFWPSIIHPDDRERAVALCVRATAEGRDHDFEYRALAVDGRIVWLRDIVRVVPDADGRPAQLRGVMIDITAIKQSGEALRLSEERFRSLVQHASDIIAVLDAGGVIRYVSPGVERTFGYQPADLIGMHCALLFDQSIRPEVRAAFARLQQLPATERRTREYPVRHRDGSLRYLELDLSNLLDDPSVGGIVINARDVTERKQFEAELTDLAFHDALTSLPNRALLLDRLKHALDGIERRNGQLAVLFLDLDRFKLINDSLGHSAGDALLVAVGERLGACLRSGDTLSRFGGDEFVVLLENVAQPTEATQAAERIVRAFRDPFLVDGHEMSVSTSIGIVVASAAHPGPEDLLRKADVALTQAKVAGRGGIVTFDEPMQRRVVARLELETDLRRAIDSGELRVHYQPEVELATGKIVGVEALVRWQHPQRGLITPGDFIGVAEETGLVIQIGRWVLGEACRQAAHWQRRFPSDPPLAVAVNLSAWNLTQLDLVQEVARVVQETGLAPGSLWLELTESVLMDDTSATAGTLDALRSVGVQLALDDFGTGYSSLSYLRRLPVGMLKIDRSFIVALESDEGTAAIVQAVVTLAHALGMRVTAEGVGNVAQLERARALGCDWAQGYHFARALPAERVEGLLRTGLPPAGLRHRS